MVFVIGSGPAGVACTSALLGRGVAVTMLDGGGELEPDRQQHVAQLRGLAPAQWRGPSADFMKQNVAPDRKGVGKKYLFGSDYPYRDVDRLLPTDKHEVDTSATLAVGGFSAVWGAAILPYLQDDIREWPITSADLAPHYRAVLSFMDTSMQEDGLAELFPLFSDSPLSLRRSRQADTLLNHMQSHRQRLQAQGIWFGASRLAARPNESALGPGCAYCGLCMYGCPYELIYSTTTTLRRFASNANFQRAGGIVVERLQQTAHGINIFASRRADGRPVEFHADRVYLAAGPLASTRILLRSMEAWDQPVVLRDSQYFLFPLLRYAGEPGVMEESLHTLSQAFIEIRDSQLGERTIHLQVYTYNDLYAGALRKTLGPAWPLLKPMSRALLSRMLIVQGYLHSDYSPSIRITLAKDNVLRLDGVARQDGMTDRLLKDVVRKLSRNAKYLRARPLGFMMNKPLPGRGFHSGGTFPMRNSPGRLETDVLGRPAGFENLHVVDSTVLPSIPATTITFSVMANAHRIGSAHERN